MNRIDRLLAAAGRFQRHMIPTVATIIDGDDGYVLSFRLWDGIDGSGEHVITETFGTLDDAKAGYNEFLRRYSAGKYEPMLIDMTGR